MHRSEWPLPQIEALGHLGDLRAVSLQIPLLDHRREEVAAKAAEALGLLGDARAIEALEQARASWLRQSPFGRWTRHCIDQALARLRPAGA